MYKHPIVISFNSLISLAIAIGQIYNKNRKQTNLSVYVSKIILILMDLTALSTHNRWSNTNFPTDKYHR